MSLARLIPHGFFDYAASGARRFGFDGATNQLALYLNTGKLGARWRPFHPTGIKLQYQIAKSARSDCNDTLANIGSERSSAWLEHLLWEQDVAGSNPVAPTTFLREIMRKVDLVT